MKLREYFLKALNAQAYYRRSWVISLFGIYRHVNQESKAPYLLERTANEVFFIDPETQQKVVIENVEPDKVAMQPLDPLTLQKGDLPNVTGKTDTTYGNALVNMQVLVDVFGDIIPFQTGAIKARALEDMLITPIKEGEVTIEQLERFRDNVSALGGYTQVAVPAASPQSLTGHPDRKKVKAQLFEKYKDSLDDPATIALIAKELEDLDREYIKGSISEGFYIKNKSYSVVRQRLHYMQGAEQTRESKKLHLIENALADGINIDDLPAMLTTQRLGAHARGANTALGGESVKFYLRAFQNVVITEEDCGSVLGLTYPVNTSNWKDYVDLYELGPQNKPRLITTEYAKSKIGSTITVRSPLFCHTSGNGLCYKCMGEVNRNNGKSLAELASNIGSAHMNSMMQLAHGTSLKLQDYDPITSLS